MGYPCIAIKSYANIKVVCLTVYTITDIVVETCYYFLKFQFTRKSHIFFRNFKNVHGNEKNGKCDYKQIQDNSP